jgi:DNA helicase II / ATP-dependent DNA helicase PcrA
MTVSRANEYAIFGPPGTGKTTSLKDAVGKAVHEYGADKVMVCSFTKAAAAEIMDRGIAVEDGNVGTLHAICFRALDRPTLAETKLADFNASSPAYRLSGKGRSVDEPFDTLDNSTRGDTLLARYQLNRARLIPREGWAPALLNFAKYWEGWKRESDLMDFTDLLDNAFASFDGPPKLTEVMYIDEAQDLSRLQWQGLRKWGNRVRRVVFLGDDDQTIYTFAGADANSLNTPEIPQKNKRFLRQSHRLPEAVMDYSTAWIRRCSKRQDKEFKPRCSGGEVTRLRSGNWQDPHVLVRDVVRRVGEGSSCMILAPCSYMLLPTIKALRDAGQAFHNPYRRARGDWNPLGRGAGSAGNRLRAFMTLDESGLTFRWTNRELELWTQLIKTEGVLQRGAKKVIKALADTEPNIIFDPRLHPGVFEPGLIEKLWPPSVDFIVDHALETKRRALEFPARLVHKHGFGVFEETPPITIGTIHSVKGGQADVVYLFPDLSRLGMGEWDRIGDPRDSVIRMFYVGMTRAREALVISPPESYLSAPI